MKPVLFELFGLQVYSYTVFAVLGYFAGLAWAWYEAKRRGLDLVHVTDLSLFLFIFGFVGARVLYIIVYPERFSDDWIRVLKIWQGGLVFYGGLIGAVIATVVYLRWHKLSLALWTDVFAPSAMAGLMLGRIGCFLNGCCYGKIAPASWPEGLPFKVKYPYQKLRSLLDIDYRYPSPFYESMAALAIFLFLAWFSRHKRRPGQVFWLMVLLYGLARFLLEFLRGDNRGVAPLINLSTSQAISLMGILVALIFLFWPSRPARQPAPDSENPEG